MKKYLKKFDLTKSERSEDLECSFYARCCDFVCWKDGTIAILNAAESSIEEYLGG